MIKKDDKYRSRRFLLALLLALGAVGFLLLGATALLLGRPIDGAAALLSTYALSCGGVLGGYGFTRSSFVARGSAPRQESTHAQ